jgi:hypothetical protein
MDVTESRGQVVKPPASYSGGLGFKSRAETGYLTVCLWFSSVHPGKSREIGLKRGHDRFYHIL